MNNKNKININQEVINTKDMIEIINNINNKIRIKTKDIKIRIIKL